MAWDDPAGDIMRFSNAPDQPRIDIVRVEAQGREGALHLRVRIDGGFDKFFAYTSADGKKYAGSVANFFIDTDNSTATGGQPMWPDEAKRPMQGYDVQVSLLAGYRYTQGGATGSMTGDVVLEVAKYPDLQPMVSLGLNRLKQGTSSPDYEATRKLLPANARELGQKATVIKGDWVETAIPYAWLGVQEGATIRLCFYERAQDRAKGAHFSEDKTLKLGR